MVFVIAFLVLFFATDCNAGAALLLMLVFMPGLLLVWAIVEYLKALFE